MIDKLGRFKKGNIPWNKGKHPEYMQGKNHPMYGIHRYGKESPRWKGGQKKHDLGYIYIWKPEHPFATKQKYVRRSRLIMEKMIGRYLKPEERVHHKGTKYPISSIENKQDDRPENLKLFATESKHQKFHRLILI